MKITWKENHYYVNNELITNDDILKRLNRIHNLKCKILEAFESWENQQIIENLEIEVFDLLRQRDMYV